MVAIGWCIQFWGEEHFINVLSQTYFDRGGRKLPSPLSKISSKIFADLHLLGGMIEQKTGENGFERQQKRRDEIPNSSET